MPSKKNKRDPLFESVTRKELIFHGAYLDLLRLTVRVPNGRTAHRETVRVRDAVGVMPVDKDGTVHLIRQHRPAIGRTIMEIPAGVLDSRKETPEACARRECEEETGIIPGKLKKLITYSHAEGYSTGFITLFLATDLKHTGKLNLDESEFVEQVKMPFSKLLKMIARNEIIDSKTMLCALMSRKYRF
jgi:ADP-ribose pyrophosphatase